MGFLYGNISQHIPRTNFKIYTIFPSKYDMERSLELEIERVKEFGDTEMNVPLFSYVLIDYRTKPHDELNKTDNFLDESEYYNVNKLNDLNRYEANFDQTVWQKQNPDVDAIDFFILQTKSEIRAKIRERDGKEREQVAEIHNYRKNLSESTNHNPPLTDAQKNQLLTPISKIFHISSPEDNTYNAEVVFGDIAIDVNTDLFYIRNATPAWVLVEGNSPEGQSYQEIFQLKEKECEDLLMEIERLESTIPGDEQEYQITKPYYYAAIARIHSILPIFEQEGSYYIDILDPLHYDKSMFGGGKNVWPLFEITDQLGS